MKDSVIIAGIGGGGCNAVAHIARHHGDRPRLLVLDTEVGPQMERQGVRQVLIGKDIMKEMGTGGDPRVGRRAAESDIEMVRDLFKDVGLAFIIVGLGGGTGTGAAPLVAEAAAAAGAVTLCFAMLPFEFEGARRMEHARRGLMALRAAADGVICMPNQRLFKAVERKTSVAGAFKKADEMIGQGVYAMWSEMCRREGVKGIQLNFDDLRALIQNGSGRCVFASAQASGPNRVEKVLKEIQNSPLLNEGKVLANAYAFLVSIAGGPDLSLQEVNEIVAGIPSSNREDALIKTGVSCDSSRKGRLLLTVLVSERENSGLDVQRAAVGEDEGYDERVVSGSSKPAGNRPESTGKGKARKLKQTSLFDSERLGRFKGVDPTIIDGNNLDIPTFIRQRILIRKPRNNLP